MCRRCNKKCDRNKCIRGDLIVKGDLRVKGNCDCGKNNCDCARGKKCILPFPVFPDPSVPATLELTGKVAIVTGVSRGNGRAIAQALKAEGAIVIGTSRKAVGFPVAGQYQKPHFIPQVDPTAPDNTIPGVPQTCDFLLELDITSSVSLASFTTAVEALFAGALAGKKLDILVTNAARRFSGAQQASVAAGPAIAAKYAEGLTITSLNQNLIWLALFKFMPTDGYARICNIASIETFTRRGMAASPYPAGKQAVRQYRDAFFAEVESNSRFLPGNPYADFQFVEICPNAVSTTLLLEETPSGTGVLQGVFDIFIQGVGFEALNGWIATVPVSSNSTDVAGAVVQSLKMKKPYMDVLVQTESFAPFAEENWCGNPNGLYPAPRDCINTKDPFMTYDLDAVFSLINIPLGTTCFYAVSGDNQGELPDWNIKAAGTYQATVAVVGPPTDPSNPLTIFNHPDFDVRLSVNGGPFGAPLVYTPEAFVSKYSPYPPVTNAYVGDFDIAGVAGSVVEVVAKTFSKGGVPLPDAPVSRVVHLVIS